MADEFSVLMSVYFKDRPDWLRAALESVVSQSALPNEIVLVKDGPLTQELNEVIDEYSSKYPIFNIVSNDKNLGLGKSLRRGVKECSCDIVARMDSDDICLPERFEKQLRSLKANPEIDIVGGQMTEFIGSPDNIIGTRVVPLDNTSIYEYMKGRCGLNHVTVMFRKESVLKAGNYQDWFWNEDYYLWVRMMITGCHFANLPDVLVNVRCGPEQYSRRGGIQYFESNKGIQKLLLEHKLTNRVNYAVNIVKCFIVQIVLPNKARGWVYRTFARG